MILSLIESSFEIVLTSSSKLIQRIILTQLTYQTLLKSVSEEYNLFDPADLAAGSIFEFCTPLQTGCIY